MTYHHRDDCRLCKSSDLAKILSLTPTPPANAFVDAGNLESEQQCYPLDLWFCRQCTHLQLLDIVDPGELFSNYVYVSGTSPVFVRHFEDYAGEVMQLLSPRSPTLAVDIGSNDGTLLRSFKDRGCNVIGIDPAVEIAQNATAAGIETLATFFDRGSARKILETHGEASIITANNVFAHIDNPDEVVEGIKILLAGKGIFVFEVSYMLDMYEKKYFDMIYHEHLDYHTVRPLVDYFQGHGMELVRVQRVSTHGGSIRCFVQYEGGGLTGDGSVEEAVRLEKEKGLHDESMFVSFADDISSIGNELKTLVGELLQEGKTIAAYGAPAKATTLMYHFDLSAADIMYIIDDSPIKQGLFSPGMHIPVRSSAELEENRPDYLLILAWNFAEPIIRSNQAFLDKGGRFIVPLPKPEII